MNLITLAAAQQPQAGGIGGLMPILMMVLMFGVL